MLDLLFRRMVLKKVDNRIRCLIESAVSNRHRSVFLVVGERARDQVVILHHILSKAQLRARPSVLWCYKKELGFTSHRQKRMKKLRRKMRAGQLDPKENEDPFEMFIATTDIRYCYYAETNRILGNTFGMCVLQDFEALTPNILARTVETVEGGGIVVILLNEGLESLQQLSNRITAGSAAKDTKKQQHAKNDEEAGAAEGSDDDDEVNSSASSRFNKRFLLSLGDCNNCLVIDDQLRVLPIFARGSSSDEKGEMAITSPLKVGGNADPLLVELRNSFAGTQPAAALVGQCCTLDQAKATLRCIDVLADPPSAGGTVVSLTAGRGRGKSAALGLAISAAVSLGYANILVTSPAVENVRTLFEFVQKGLTALNYERHIDFDVVSGQIVAASSNVASAGSDNSNKAVVRVTVHRDRRRQNIVFLQPDDALRQIASPNQRFNTGAIGSNGGGAFDLVLIDEAAAIPLPKVRSLLSGSLFTFMASTVSGYEGTGRSLSLKLIHQLRSSSTGGGEKVVAANNKKRLHELSLTEPIRYGVNDPVESWLTRFLCLDVTEIESIDSGVLQAKSMCPPPDACELFYVNRDALFSYHRAAEKFLNRVWSLYVAAHYKNSPNDMQLLADAPTHHIFVLLAPLPEGATSAELPDVLCVIQVCLEGRVTKSAVMASLARGKRPAGDLVPWTLSQQYQDTNFATSLSGARIVRIATNPDFGRMGYGSRAIRLLGEYYEGRLYVPPSDNDDAMEASGEESRMPPLLSRLSERKPEQPIDYLSVSFGLGLDGQLFRFWRRGGFVPLYLRQTASDVTGENSCIMLRALSTASVDEDSSPHVRSIPPWLIAYAVDFRRRLLSLLGLSFAEAFPPLLALDLVECVTAVANQQSLSSNDDATCGVMLTPHDLRRLSAYSSNQVDHHLISDLLPPLAWLYFLGLIDEGKTTVSRLQAAILVGLGLQRRTVDTIAGALSPAPPADPLPATQVLALLCRTVRRLLTAIEAKIEHRYETTKQQRVPNKNQTSTGGKSEKKSVEVEKVGEEGGEEKEMEEETKAVPPLDLKVLHQFVIRGTEEEWAEATATGAASLLREGSGEKVSGFLTVKTKPQSMNKRKLDGSSTADGAEEGAAGAADLPKKNWKPHNRKQNRSQNNSNKKDNTKGKFRKH